MKAIFGILSLIIVLAIVGSIAKKQLQAVNGGMSAQNAKAASEAGLPDSSRRDPATVAVPRGMPGAELADPNGLTVRDDARSIQQKARDDTARALQQGAQRNRQAEP